MLKVNLDFSPPQVSLAYRNDTISCPYALSIAKSFQSILDDFISNSRFSGGLCKTISIEDQRQIVSWNPAALYTNLNCMHHLVEAAVRCAPHTEAICAWDGSATYAQLDGLSSVAARLLGKLGVGPRTFVPFAFEKSMWTVVATLAILKAGAAFVPLDVSSSVLPTKIKFQLAGGKLIYYSQAIQVLGLTKSSVLPMPR